VTTSAFRLLLTLLLTLGIFTPEGKKIIITASPCYTVLKPVLVVVEVVVMMMMMMHAMYAHKL